MCIANNPYRQPSAPLIEFDGSQLDAATVLQDNVAPIFTSINAAGSKGDTNMKEHLSSSNLIRILIFVCVFPIIIVSIEQKFRAQREEMNAQMDEIQATMTRINALRDKQNQRLADLDMLTQQIKDDF